MHYEPEYLLKRFTDHFKQKYKVECISALHHNKRKTNYHIHLIFAERQLLDKPIEKIATRNMFYDEKGKHRRTKKEILDEAGYIRKKCKVVKKGEVYERNLFTTKDELFKADGFLDEVKRLYTDLINVCAINEEDKLHVFDRNGMYLATKKIGKNNPKVAEIEADNKVEKMKAELSKVLRDAGYANAAEFFTELFTMREEKRKYEEACKVWQEECVRAEIEATKDSQYYEEVVRVGRNRSR